MQEMIDVATGQVAVTRGQVILRAVAIGSCIAMAVYDASAKNAGLAHIMLPGQAPQDASEKMKYALDAIEYLLNQMTRSGSDVRTLTVCLVGAGNVLQRQNDTICQNNIESVTGILAAKNIPVQAKIFGGIERKSAFLDAENGHFSYSRGDGPVQLLWPPENGM